MPELDVDKHGNIQFSSGRFLMPNAGIIGISHDGTVGEGYDSCGDNPGEGLMAEDLIELADLMIERWQRYKRTAGGR